MMHTREEFETYVDYLKRQRDRVVRSARRHIMAGFVLGLVLGLALALWA